MEADLRPVAGRRIAAKVYRRGQVQQWAGRRPLVAATDGSWAPGELRHHYTSGFAYLTSDGRWGIAGRRHKDGDPTGPAGSLVTELRAVEFCLSMAGEPPPLVLVDSASAVRYMHQWQAGGRPMPAGYSRPRAHGRSTLDRLADRVSAAGDTVRFQLVAAHRGHLLNEAADALASIGRRRVSEGFDEVIRAEGIADGFLKAWWAGGGC